MIISKFKEGDITTYAYGQWQHNWGQILQIEGLDLPTGTQVHFSLSETGGEAIPMVAVRENDVLQVEVPGQLLDNEESLADFNVYAYVYTSDGNSGQTIRKIIIPVEARPDIGTDVPEHIPQPLDLMMEQVMQEIENATKDKVFRAEYGITPYAEIKEAYERGLEVKVKYAVNNVKKLEAGTYDADGNLLQTWDELMDAWKNKYPTMNCDVSISLTPPHCVSNVIPSEAEMLIISDTVTSIGDYMFYSYGSGANLKKIIIPESVNLIGWSCFGGSQSKLQEVYIANKDIALRESNYNTPFTYCTNISKFYYSGTLTAQQLGVASVVTIVPCEQAPNEAKGYIGSVEYYLGNLEFADDSFVFYTTKDDMPLKITCGEDGWSSEEIKYALPSDIPTKVSELENDAGYGKKYVVVNGFSTVKDFEQCINDGVVMYYKTRGYPNSHNDYDGDVTKDVYLIYSHSVDSFPDSKTYYFSGIHKSKILYVGYAVDDNVCIAILEYEVPIPTKISDLKNDSGYAIGNEVFMATYGTTTYEEILEAYRANKGIILNVPGAQVGINHLVDLTMTLVRVDNNNNNSTDRYSFTFFADENGISHYAAINYDTKKWNYWDYNYALNITRHDESIVSLINKTNVIPQITTDYKREEISANGRFQLREKGLYIFGGSDYDLNLCRADGSTVGKTEALVVIVFCTEADETGAFRVYVMQNYKATLGVPSMDGMPYDNFTSDCYIHNTNGSAGAYVYYMRQNEV